MPNAIEQLDFSDYDLVISTSHAMAKEVHVALSPIRIGGGVRLKMFESIACGGRPVISTRVGIEGLAAELAEQVIIPDSPKNLLLNSKSFVIEALIKTITRKAMS